jgi:hypothetical protein
LAGFSGVQPRESVAGKGIGQDTAIWTTHGFHSKRRNASNAKQETETILEVKKMKNDPFKAFGSAVEDALLSKNPKVAAAGRLYASDMPRIILAWLDDEQNRGTDTRFIRDTLVGLITVVLGRAFVKRGKNEKLRDLVTETEEQFRTELRQWITRAQLTDTLSPLERMIDFSEKFK